METEFLPDWTCPPGDTILDFLEWKNVSKEKLADTLHLSLEDTDSFLKGGLPLSEDIAIKLETLFGPPFDFWLRREEQYRKDLVRLSKNRVS